MLELPLTFFLLLLSFFSLSLGGLSCLSKGVEEEYRTGCHISDFGGG
jgi:hypothetical protein